jgi:DNA-directed RNA polymerase sigma subunit (sigma70/sigma32)
LDDYFASKGYAERKLRLPYSEPFESAEVLLDPRNCVRLERLSSDLYEEDFAPKIDAKIDAEFEPDAREQLAKLFRCLTTRERQVVLIRHDLDGARDNTFQEIASTLDISYAWVYKTYNRAMKKLREEAI